MPAAPAPVPPPDDGNARLQQYIPPALLRRLRTARYRRSVAGERRIVTIVFCDVQGSTALAEKLDPEEWVEIMNGAFEQLIKAVYQQEGTLARLMGDAVLAFFGAPIAHEDDPRRAVMAGLQMVEGMRRYSEQVRARHGFDLNVRVGINTGLVVVGEVGSDLRVEYTAMGDAVNLAARMEQTAAPGTVQLTAATHRLVDQLFDFEPLGGIEVKGKSEPVEAYRAVAARKGVAPVRGIAGLSSPLVGRDEELVALQARVQGLMDGRGGIVAITGEAGLGKSRLVAELVEWMRAQQMLGEAGSGHEQDGILWLAGRSFSFERSLPYAPFRVMLETFFGLEALSREEQYAQLLERVDKVAPGETGFLVPYLAAMLDIPLPPDAAQQIVHLMPPQLQQAILASMQWLIRRLASWAPVVLFLEDLHWADELSLALLEGLLPLVRDQQLLVVAAFRPHEEDPSAGFHQRAQAAYEDVYTTIALQPLGEQDARAFVANLLHIEDLPERVRALILRKAEGNPFFVEEVIRSLLDSGLVIREGGRWRATREIENVSVPDTLVGVITARLDRLEEQPRVTAQTASVVGREFARQVLVEVHEQPETVDPSLLELTTRDVIRPQRDAEQEFAFKHVLTQETVYSSILLRERRRLHVRVAECLERTSRERPDEIARHFLEGREETRALPYVIEAAQMAAMLYASSVALEGFRKALEIMRANPEAADDGSYRIVYEGLAKSLELTGDVPGAQAAYREMERVGRERSAMPMVVSALNKNALLTGVFLGDVQSAEPMLLEAEELAREYRDVEGLLELSITRCGACLPAGQFDNAMAYLGESVENARQLGMAAALARGLAHSATTLTFMGRFDEAEAAAEECLRVAEDLGNLEYQAEVLGGALAVVPFMRGQPDVGYERITRGMELAQRTGAIFPLMTSLLGRLQMAEALGRYQDALDTLALIIPLLRGLGNMGMSYFPMVLASGTSIHAALGETARLRWEQEYGDDLRRFEPQMGGGGWASIAFLLLERGEVDRAEELLQQAMTVPSMSWVVERPRYMLGMSLVKMMRGDLEGAEAALTEARAYARSQDIGAFDPIAEFVDAQLQLAKGNLSGGSEALARAESIAGRMGYRLLLVRILAVRASMLAAAGREEEARNMSRRAEAVAREIADELRDAELRASFVRSVDSLLSSVPL